MRLWGFDYTFYIKSDEWSELYISTDEDPRNKRRIAFSHYYAPDFVTRNWEQRSRVISLSKGRSYYIEALFKDQGDNLNVEVAWQKPYEGVPESELTAMPLSNISSIERDATQGFLTVTENKTKVTPTESVTLTANGCYYGKISWKAGIELIQDPVNIITSITKVGAGIYQAICVGDPTINDDWVKVEIGSINAVVPNVSGKTHACPAETVTLTASNPSSAYAGYTFRWYILETEANKEFYRQNAASADLFETAAHIFRIVNSPTVTVTGPGTYFVRTITPFGWKEPVREYVVQLAIPENLSAINNSPAELGSPVRLAIGQVLTASSYNWTGPNGYIATGFNPLISSLAQSHVGTYTVTVTTTGGCTVTRTTTVTLANCDIYIKSTNAANQDTLTLKRVTGQTGVFESLKLKVLPFEGTNTFDNYNVSWYFNGNPIAGAPNNTEYSINKPGEYKALLSLKANPANVCEAIININAVPCKVYTDKVCGTLPNVILPDIQAAGISLVAGDKFTAGDYTVVVTEITSGSNAGWKGKGYVEIKMVMGIIAKRVSVFFEDAVVNDCYELASGKVQTEYDPNWGNVLDIDKTICNI